jgi:glycerol transport system permease protein
MPKKGWGVPVCLILMSMPLLIPWNVVGAMWNIFALTRYWFSWKFFKFTWF